MSFFLLHSIPNTKKEYFEDSATGKRHSQPRNKFCKLENSRERFKDLTYTKVIGFCMEIKGER